MDGAEAEPGSPGRGPSCIYKLLPEGFIKVASNPHSPTLDLPDARHKAQPFPAASRLRHRWATRLEPGAGSWEPGDGSRKPGAGSREPGADWDWQPTVEEVGLRTTACGKESREPVKESDFASQPLVGRRGIPLCSGYSQSW